MQDAEISVKCSIRPRTSVCMCAHIEEAVCKIALLAVFGDENIGLFTLYSIPLDNSDHLQCQQYLSDAIMGHLNFLLFLCI